MAKQRRLAATKQDILLKDVLKDAYAEDLIIFKLSI